MHLDMLQTACDVKIKISNGHTRYHDWTNEQKEVVRGNVDGTRNYMFVETYPQGECPTTHGVLSSSSGTTLTALHAVGM